MYLTILCGMWSCTKEHGNEVQMGEKVKVRLMYTLDTSNGSDMTRASTSNGEVFNEFFEKIKSGDLLASTYNITFTNVENGTIYSFSGNWKDNTFITIQTGKYNVTGYSTAEGTSIQNRCSIIFNEPIDITISSNTVSLNGIYDCALIIFNDSQIESLHNFDGENNSSFFSFNTYKYAFVKDSLYLPAHKDKAYILGAYTNGAEFQIYTGNLKFTKGKYYVYNSVDNDFNLPPMEEGEGEGENDIVTLNLPPNNEVWYTSTTGQVVELSHYPYTLISNTYESGIGKYKFAEDVVDIEAYFSDVENSREQVLQFASIILPSSIKKIDTYKALGGLYNADCLILPENLEEVGTDFMCSFGEYLEEKHLYFTSEKCPKLYSSWYNNRCFWNQSSVLYVHYPKGSDYSEVKQALEAWRQETINANNDPSNYFEYVMVETSYNLIHN